MDQENKIKLLIVQIDQLKEENKVQRMKIIDHVKERDMARSESTTPMDIINAFIDLPFIYQLCGLYR